jgi:catechol 2,3-dioxygenase-like lactoylglutathione lyase family enzyme/predicted kinase
MTPHLPAVLLVTGPPGTGKSTLIARLLPRLAAAGHALPVFTKDDFKETLFETLGAGDRDWSGRLGRASMALLRHVLAQELAAGRSCLVEANFHASLATPEFAALRARQPFALLQLLCSTRPQVLLERLRRRTDLRERHPGHLDPEWIPALRAETLAWRAEPLALESETLEVDTTDWEALNLDAITARVVAFLLPRPPAPRYVHTNLIARDWRRLAVFYTDVLGCTPAGPERDLAGPAIDAATALPGAHIRGIHLRLPGSGPSGPTLEIFTYSPAGLRAGAPTLNRAGLAHLAFAVDDVTATRDAVLAAGGGQIGEIVRISIPEAGTVTFVYVTDPEGNPIELQRWERD